jgi:hypothetical protein
MSTRGVLQLDLCTFDTIKVWESAADAADKLSIAEWLISECCLGRVDEAGTFRWAFSDSFSVASEIAPATKRKREGELEASSVVVVKTPIISQPSVPQEATEMPAPTLPTTPLVRPQQQTVLLGGVEIKALAFGTLSWGVAYSNYPNIARPDEATIHALIAEALVVGPTGAATLFDTADTYSPLPPGDEGFMESLLERELTGNPGALARLTGLSSMASLASTPRRSPQLLEQALPGCRRRVFFGKFTTQNRQTRSRVFSLLLRRPSSRRGPSVV